MFPEESVEVSSSGSGGPFAAAGKVLIPAFEGRVLIEKVGISRLSHGLSTRVIGKDAFK